MEVNHILPKKATGVAETRTIISKVSRLFFKEFLLFTHVFQPMTLFKDFNWPVLPELLHEADS